MSAPTYNFGDFVLDPARFELRRSGRTLKLERIPLELLILLVQREGQVVSRQEIVDRVWGKDVFVDTEHGINTAIRKIRTVLREDIEKPRFIQTVSGKGYRFVPEAPTGNPETTPPDHLAAADAATMWVEAEPSSASPGAISFRRLGVVVGLLLVFAAAVGINIADLRDLVFDSHGVGPIHSIAVLPLANLSGDSSQDYFADGMTDELITALAQNRSLRIVSRTSAMQYKGVNKPSREIAKALGVDGVLEGSVNRSENHVHVNLQLIYALTDSHVWAKSYDRDLNAAISLPQELSQTIATQAGVEPTPAKLQRAINPAAHDAYLHGRYFWFVDNRDRSREYFEQAVRLQPDYAAAWSGLADSYTVRAAANMVPPNEVIPKAKEMAEKAVTLDDSLPEAHNSLAAVYLFGEWDLKRADLESQRAITLTPPYPEAHHLRCYVLAALNRSDEAVEEQKQGMEIDPFSRPWALGLALIRARQFDAALNELRMRAEAQPQSDIHFILADAYWQKGMWGEYSHEVEQGYVAIGDKNSVAGIRRAFQAGGGRNVAEWDLNNSKSQARKSYVSPWQLAYLSARLQRKNETISFLEDAYREHSARLIFLQVEPVFDFLHSDERYRALVRKIGLPPGY